MSEPDDAPKPFLQRWSERKQAAETGAREQRVTPAPPRAEAAASQPATDGAAPVLPAFDPESLPPIESINAASDLRAFLAPGIPADITRAALRRAWSSDPAIRDFVGLAENQWDFTNPDSVPGFGTLDVTESMRRMIADLLDHAVDEEAADRLASSAKAREQALDPHAKTNADDGAAQAQDLRPAAALASAPPDLAPADAVMTPAEPMASPLSDDAQAPRQNRDEEQPVAPATRRRHGGALPK